MASSARPSCCVDVSTRVTSMPAVASTWAMPLPIVPAPTTVARCTTWGVACSWKAVTAQPPCDPASSAKGMASAPARRRRSSTTKAS